MKCSPAVGAAAEPGVCEIDRLVAFRIVQRRVDVGRQRHDTQFAQTRIDRLIETQDTFTAGRDMSITSATRSGRNSMRVPT